VDQGSRAISLEPVLWCDDPHSATAEDLPQASFAVMVPFCRTPREADQVLTCGG
jgi:hypothetical protein